MVEKGPMGWQNWRAYDAGGPLDERLEAAIYSDAHVTGELTKELGPYQVLNAVAVPPSGLSLCMVVRAES